MRTGETCMGDAAHLLFHQECIRSSYALLAPPTTRTTSVHAAFALACRVRELLYSEDGFGSSNSYDLRRSTIS